MNFTFSTQEKSSLIAVFTPINQEPSHLKPQKKKKPTGYYLQIGNYLGEPFIEPGSIICRLTISVSTPMTSPEP